MAAKREGNRKPLGKLFIFALLFGLVLVVYLSPVGYRPDRPVATIVPGSSPAPAFVVQIIRPRLGLPLGGLLPPELFGLEESLVFRSESSGATIGRVEPQRIELSADKWELVLVLDDDGLVTAETHVVFEFIFEDSLRRVRCWAGDPVVGTFKMTERPGGAGFSGNFDIELARCEDADTGKSLGWPPKPLVLHGSFDRLCDKKVRP